MAGFIVETEYTGRGLKAQFKQADRLNAKYIVVLNSEDLNNNEIKIKDNKSKEEEVISLDALIYYLDEKLNTMEDETEDFDFDLEHEYECSGHGHHCCGNGCCHEEEEK